MLRRSLMGAALAAAMLSSGPVTVEARAQTVRWAAAGDPNTLDPHSQNVGTVTAMLQQIYEPLIGRRPDLGLAPALALSWSQEEPTRWRFKLRPGVRFHEGQSFTADDVVFSIARAQSPTSNFVIYVDTIASVTAVDDATVDIVTRAPDPILPNKLASVFVMSRAWAEANNASRPQNTRQREETHTLRHTNGTGGFRLAIREPDVRTVLRRHDDWAGWNETVAGQAPGNVREVVFRPVSSDATRIAALLSGEVDFVLDPPLQDLNRLRAAPGVRVLEGPEVRTIFLGLDVFRDALQFSDVRDRNPLKDVRVRRALYHAIDVEAIRRTTMRGQSIPTGALFPEQVNGYSREEDVRLPYDQNRARALLGEAGYPQGFGITLNCPNNRYINDEQICQAVAAMWSRVGVRTTVQAEPLAGFLAKLQGDELSAYLFGWGVPTLDGLYSFQSLLATRAPGQGDGIWNNGRYSSPEMDALIARMKTESGEPRAAAMRDASRLLRQDVPLIPLHHQMIPWATRANLSIPHAANNQPWFRWAVVN